MRTLLPLVLILSLGGLPGAAPADSESDTPRRPVTRCGWFHNPTPGNASLVDADGEWTVAVQGGHQADGDWPSFSRRQWVRTNGSYGYGCACLRVTADPVGRTVRQVHAATVRPLRSCREDRRLPVP